MIALLVCALVESCHRLIGRPCLHLHEVGPAVITLGTLLFNAVNVFPGSTSSENVVNLLKFCVSSRRYPLRDVIDVRARGAGKSVAGVGSLFAL